MDTYSVESARLKLGDIITNARLHGKPALITRYGYPAVVVISAELYERAVEPIGDADAA